jgi:hypothetical protein
MSRRTGAVRRAAGSPGPVVPAESNPGAGPASTTPLSPILAKLVATARAELDCHISADGACAECGMAWPCETACVAAFTLEAVGGG